MGIGTMGWSVIEKRRGGWAIEPNLLDYARTEPIYGCAISR